MLKFKKRDSICNDYLIENIFILVGGSTSHTSNILYCNN